MKIPLYLRIVLPVTLVACGYAAWSDGTPENASVVRAKPAKIKTTRMTEQTKALPELEVSVTRNLFPNQGPDAYKPANVSTSDSDSSEKIVLPPVPVQAPPFPLKVSGIWVEGAQRKIILTKGDKTTILCQGCGKNASPKVGDILERHYRLEKIENERITFTYLPLQLKQIVDIDVAISGTGN
ncbi:hypothetical protein ACVBEF_04285 [Glaciimonas sp. GG7]